MKEYFLPVYLTWMFITPILMIVINTWLTLEAGQNFFDAIPWGRVPSLFALFGVIWPLTIVISPAFLESFARETGYTFIESLTSLVFDGFLLKFPNNEARQMFWATIGFIIAWIGPVIHFTINLLKHKQLIAQQSEEEIDWYDYIAGFI